MDRPVRNIADCFIGLGYFACGVHWTENSTAVLWLWLWLQGGVWYDMAGHRS